MLGNEGQAAGVVELLPLTVAAPDTAGATSAAWVDVREYVGDLVFLQFSANITGSLAGKIQTASDDAGSDAEDLTGGTFTTRTTGTHLDRCVVDVKKTLGFVQYVGTVGTGPVDLAVALLARPRMTA